MILHFLLFSILNCFSLSEKKALDTLSNVGNGYYIVSKTINVDIEKEFLLPFISDFEYLIVVENSNETKPMLIIDGEDCTVNHKVTKQSVDGFKTISVRNANCSTIIISFRRLN